MWMFNECDSYKITVDELTCYNQSINKNDEGKEKW